ncbi:MAG: MOSC domain-containing protein [Betaproteobacteria bacterium]|nr:MOSC domain-containing protein [Betaproteobacteria bacterium]
MTTARVVQVCTGRARALAAAGREVLSAIGKTPVTSAVAVGPLGLQGDEQADLTVHGGLAKAVYAYPCEHLPFWQTVRAQAGVAAWGEALPPGLFGENLVLQGLTEADLFIGDRLVLPGCVLAVSEPRQPCFKFNAAMGFVHAAKLMQQSGYCGAYLAVLEPGVVAAGDSVTLQPGPREVNLRELFLSRRRG